MQRWSNQGSLSHLTSYPIDHLITAGGAKYIPTGRGYALVHKTFVQVGGWVGPWPSALRRVGQAVRLRLQQTFQLVRSLPACPRARVPA